MVIKISEGVDVVYISNIGLVLYICNMWKLCKFVVYFCKEDNYFKIVVLWIR